MEYESWQVGLLVFLIILVSGVMLLLYIALTMRYSKRHKQLLENKLESEFQKLKNEATQLFFTIPSHKVYEIRKHQLSTSRYGALEEELSQHLLNHSPRDRENILTTILYHYFGGYSDSTYNENCQN